MSIPHRRTENSGLIFALVGFVVLSCVDAVVKTVAGLFAPTGVAALRYVIGAAGLGGE